MVSLAIDTAKKLISRFDPSVASAAEKECYAIAHALLIAVKERDNAIAELANAKLQITRLENEVAIVKLLTDNEE